MDERLGLLLTVGESGGLLFELGVALCPVLTSVRVHRGCACIGYREAKMRNVIATESIVLLFEAQMAPSYMNPRSTTAQMQAWQRCELEDAVRIGTICFNRQSHHSSLNLESQTLLPTQILKCSALSTML